MKCSPKILISLLYPIIGLPLFMTSANVSAQVDDEPKVVEQTFESGKIIYTLKECSRISKNIVCNLTILNNLTDDDANFYIFNGTDGSNKQTNIVDTEGIEYFAQKVTLNQQSCNQGCGRLDFRLVKGVVYKVNIIFGNVPPSVTSLSLVDIRNSYNVKFRNVPVVASTSSTITPQPVEVVSNPSTERTNPNPSSSILSICYRGDKTFVAAETDSFHVSICGRKRPLYYIGSAKKDGKFVKLALSSASQNRYVARSGIYSYIVTPQYLTVTKNSRTILQESVTVGNWR